MNKRLKKKKDTVKQWNGVRIITLSTPRWKRRKARMKMSRRVKIALIERPNKNHRVYPISTIKEAIQRFESNIKLTPADNPGNILFEKDIKHPHNHSYFIGGTYNIRKQLHNRR